jgi:RNA polymerase sigma-70 factor (ECF subfamily)
MTEREFAEELGKNLDGCFERLVRAYQDRLYSFAQRLTRHVQDAEEVVQETFVRAYQALKTYPPGRIESMDLKPWLYRILLNVFRNRIRRGCLQTVSLDKINVNSGMSKVNEATIDPESLVGESEIRKQLGKALTSLPEKYRVPVVLRYVEGIAYSEMREILKQPEGTIKANVHRGIELLRSRWIQRDKETKR